MTAALALRTDRPQIVAAILATCLYCQGEPTGCPDCLHLGGPPESRDRTAIAVAEAARAALRKQRLLEAAQQKQILDRSMSSTPEGDERETTE